MRLLIENLKKDDDSTLILRLEYVDILPGGVDLVAIDQGGKQWCIASLLPDGRLLLVGDLPDDIGLDVTENGVIRTVNNVGRDE